MHPSLKSIFTMNMQTEKVAIVNAIKLGWVIKVEYINIDKIHRGFTLTQDSWELFHSKVTELV
jgi:hypothetical protein